MHLRSWYSDLCKQSPKLKNLYMFILVLTGEAQRCSVLITDGNKLGSITENLKQNQERTTVTVLSSIV